MTPPEEALRVILEVVRILDALRVPYAVGGSLASSLHGIPRSTQDGDLVADLRAPPFAAHSRIGGSFEVGQVAQEWKEAGGRSHVEL